MGKVRRINESLGEMIIDSFAGGGGASTGIHLALGKHPDIAINHDPEALAMHAANHPETRHLISNVWDVDPREVCGDRPVGLMWASPDCTFFSKARGAQPFRDRKKARRRRGLANLVIRWAKSVRPSVIIMENVEEFKDWCPLIEKVVSGKKVGVPDWTRIGLSFRQWLGRLKACGYAVEWRQLKACDYGAPTTRRRLFLIARCDGLPIVWPEPTHADVLEVPDLFSRTRSPKKKYRSAAECIDWSIPTKSIFDRKKPLADKTMLRIARGVMKYVVNEKNPFIVPTTHGDSRGRPDDVNKPHPTAVAGGVKTGSVTAFLAKHYGGHESPGSSMKDPLSTVTTQDHHSLIEAHLEQVGGPGTAARAHQVWAFLVKFYGTEQDPTMPGPLHTITTKDRFALVTVHGIDYVIVDIHMRMLMPRELFNAQGFPPGYQIEKVPAFLWTPKSHIGKPKPKPVLRTRLTKTAQVRMCGNSVAPPVVEALVRANYQHRAARRAVA